MEAERGRFGDIAKRREKARRREEKMDRMHFTFCIEEMEEEEKEHGIVTKEMPRPSIVKYHDFLEKLWGWDRLMPKGHSVSWSDYSAYIQEYHRRNVAAVRSMDALAEACLINEERLVSEWKKIQMKSREEMVILHMTKSIVLSCLIHERARSVIIRTYLSAVLDGTPRFRKPSLQDDVSGAALLCVAKESDLTCELLRRGVDPIYDYLVNQGIEMRVCALSLMNRVTSDNSVAASVAMLGMAKEAEMMCTWMSKNNKPIDFDDEDELMPDEIVESRMIRYQTLNLMVKLLEESFSGSAGDGHKIDKEEPASRNGPGCDGDGIATDGAAKTAGCGISDVLNSQCEKDVEAQEEDDLFHKLWGWERLLPLHGSVKWSNYGIYLEEYYKHNAYEFVADAGANQNPGDLQIAISADMGAAVAKFCLKMEEELQSKWKDRVRHSMDDTLPVSTIIQSSLIKEFVLSFCGRGGELCVPSAIAFVCIAKEADLMCELLKHGAKPDDDIVQQSSVIRMFAFGPVNNLKGHEPIASVAAAMVGVANEAKKMCDWIKRENKHVNFSLSLPNELEECRLIRIKALDVMASMLQESSFPSSTMRNDAIAYD